MSSSASESRFEPRLPLLTAVVIYVVAALSLLWPILQGQFLAGSDQVSAGYAFRRLAAESMQHGGHIPQWNPYILGGMPLWAVPGHFDVFYPTAWLRWFFQADTVLNWSFFIHFIVAGVAMYALLRALRTGWTAAAVGGLAYEFSGILASQVSPGHDGKLYAAALAPFAFVALIRAIRDGRTSHFGWFALVIGLIMLTPHYLAAYYILIGCALFTLWLVFLDPERTEVTRKVPVRPLVFVALSVAIGFAVSAVELMPVQHMVAYTPRAAGGASVGYDYASTWGMAPEELMTTILPQFNGMLDHYWGRNPVKDHTEYVGALVVVLMILGLGAARRRKVLLPFAVIGVLFMMVAWGGYSSFYHLWVLLPKMMQFRAPGLAFFMTALCACTFAGLGVDDLVSGKASRTALWSALGVLGLIGLLGAGGLLQGIAEGLAIPQRAQWVIANQPELQSGAMRLLLVVVLGGVGLMMIQAGKARNAMAALILFVIVGGDNWSILRNFPHWLPPANITFKDDVFTGNMKKLTTMPFRAYTPMSPEGDSRANTLTVYSASSLMARDIPTLLGYHGMESRYFDALLGGKNVWQYQYAANMWDLYAVKYVIQTHEPEGLKGFHREMESRQLDDEPELLAQGVQAAVVMERDSSTRWVRIVPAAVKVQEEQIPPTIADPRFPLNSYVLFPDSSNVVADKPGATLPDSSGVTATLAAWVPGAMSIKLDGTDKRTTWLVVAENWYPDWHVKVDGKETTTYRGDGALLSVPIPSGAHEVSLVFDVASYHYGKIVSLIALLLVIGVITSDKFVRRPLHA